MSLRNKVVLVVAVLLLLSVTVAYAALPTLRAAVSADKGVTTFTGFEVVPEKSYGPPDCPGPGHLTLNHAGFTPVVPGRNVPFTAS